MSFSMKPAHQGNSEGVNINWEEVANQVDDGPQGARISIICDLGIQERPDGVSYEGKDDFTIVDSEDEMNELMDRAEELMGEYLFEKHSLDDWDDTEDGKIRVPFKIYSKKDAQEVAIFADLPDTYVEYVEGEEAKQYRVMLNSNFKGVIGGFALAGTPPKGKSKLWTFGGKLAKLAKATGHPEILEDGPSNMDIGLILGEPLLINIEKNKSFVSAKEFMPLMKNMEVGELDNGPFGITFANATVGVLEAAQLRKGIIDKIKLATNYEGSNMQKAIEQMEENFKNRVANKSSDSDSDDEQQEESLKRRGRKPKEETKEEVKVEAKRGRKAKIDKVVEDDGFDLDVPF